MGKRRKLLAFFRQQIALVIMNISQRFAVGFAGDFFRQRVERILIIPRHIHYRQRIGTALFLVQLTQFHKQTGDNFAVVQRFTRWLRGLEVPLQPATGVHNRTVFLCKTGRRQTEHLGLNIGGLHVVHCTVVLPEV
ncbi:hypothetical protein SRABI106_03867 [Rahnella aquatilis]|nr:hypothetical protein SRABI106_03867 [Rahnella aquatilis]